ncbi:MAG: FAD-dependent oxidoreductase [Actinobacteria bacterium]|nr:FAD-dependent oxidoreductase [Actinomycetota bacterium]
MRVSAFGWPSNQDGVHVQQGDLLRRSGMRARTLSPGSTGLLAVARLVNRPIATLSWGDYPVLGRLSAAESAQTVQSAAGNQQARTTPMLRLEARATRGSGAGACPPAPSGERRGQEAVTRNTVVLVISVDVVILGGGIQGLVLLRDLAEAGYACVLVTNADLGSGQTLHSHGLLNSGTGLLTGALQEELHGLTLPYLSRLGVGVYGESQSFLLAPTPLVDQLRPAWEANAYHPQRVSPSTLPLGFKPAESIYRVPGFNVDKRRLVEALAAGLEHLVVRGEVVDANDGVRVREAASDEVLSFEPRAIVVAAGCGSKRLLRNIFAVEEPALAKITYTKPHMICVMAPAEVLPPIGTVLCPELIVVGHRDTDADRSRERLVTWYVTPAAAAPVRHADAPDDGVAAVEAPVVTSGIEALVRLFPPLASDNHGVQATVFAGFKQDFDGLPTQRACELVRPERNLLMVLPSVLANAVPNSVDAVSVLRQRLGQPTGRAAEIPHHGGAAIGELNELSEPTTWTNWGDFARQYGVVIS